MWVTYKINCVLIMRKLSSSNSQNKLEMITNCPLTSALTLISGRWKLIILWQLHKEVSRFGELRRAIPLITEKVLTDQLRELERDGFVQREVFAQVPLKVEYRLTPLALSLIPILEQLFTWGDQHDAIDIVRQNYFDGPAVKPA